MRYLGLDYGARKIGLALSRAGIALPHSSLENDAQLMHRLGDIVRKEGVEACVLGDTRTISGEANALTEEVEVFAARLSENLGLEVFLEREAYSSVEAARFAVETGRGKRPQKRDEAAAAIILQRFLDSPRAA